MKRLVLSCGLMAVLAMACGHSDAGRGEPTGGDSARVGRADSRALKVAVMPTADCMPVYIALERGWFDSLKVDVALWQSNSQMDIDTALMGGHVAGGITDLVRVARMGKRGTAMNCVAATNTAWQLLASRTARVKEVKQLGDKMVAMARYSATDFLTDRALTGVKTSATVYRVQINDVLLRLQMLRNNEMDALWLSEPQATAARRLKASVLWDSQKEDIRLGVLAFRQQALADKRVKTQVESFLKAYNRACDSLNALGVKAYGDIMEKYCKADSKTIEELPKMQFPRAAAPREKDVEAARKWTGG